MSNHKVMTDIYDNVISVYNINNILSAKHYDGQTVITYMDNSKTYIYTMLPYILVTNGKNISQLSIPYYNNMADPRVGMSVSMSFPPENTMPNLGPGDILFDDKPFDPIEELNKPQLTIDGPFTIVEL